MKFSIKKILIALKQHLLSIIAYLIYLILWVRTLVIKNHFYQQSNPSVALAVKLLLH